MQYFIGVKLIEAEPAAKNGEPGYAIKYPDGYVSWSSKETFESAYLRIGGVENTRINEWVVDSFINDYEQTDFNEKTTLVKGMLATGFTIIEHSSCVDPANYDSALGGAICIKTSNLRCGTI
jgi:Phage protein (N4 Gp49/phage Sf6 gene 66) family